MAGYTPYIAGVGITRMNADGAKIHDLAISAGTKAMLDAGVTFDDVNHCFASFIDGDLKIPKTIFDSFGRTGASASEVDCASALNAALQTIKAGHADCTLMIGFDMETLPKSSQEAKQGQIAAVGVVLVSPSFLRSHAYLKDTSISVHGSAAVSPIYSQISGSNSEALAAKKAIHAALQNAALALDNMGIVLVPNGSNTIVKATLEASDSVKRSRAQPKFISMAGSTGLYGLCELVWQLRGWTQDRSVPGIKNCLQYTSGQDGTAYVTVLSRSAGNNAPTWEDVKHVRDGRERVGHNPAIDTKDISHEDWLAVKSRDEFMPDATGKQLSLPVKGGDRAALARL